MDFDFQIDELSGMLDQFVAQQSAQEPGTSDCTYPSDTEGQPTVVLNARNDDPLSAPGTPPCPGIEEPAPPEYPPPPPTPVSTRFF